ncbi:hypothetical protein AAZV13_02G125700 [Glycine max]
MGSKVRTLVLLSLFCLALFVSLHQARAAKSHNNDNNHNVARLKGRKELNRCNLFIGSWVIDPSSHPLYDSSSCPFIDAEFDCQKYGRPDRQYLKYSWKPDSCALPRFDGVSFLNKWKGKKIMFVGDSLSLNMWESLSCMLHASVPNATTSFVRRQAISTVTFEVCYFSFCSLCLLSDLLHKNTS